MQYKCDGCDTSEGGGIEAAASSWEGRRRGNNELLLPDSEHLLIIDGKDFLAQNAHIPRHICSTRTQPRITLGPPTLFLHSMGMTNY